VGRRITTVARAAVARRNRAAAAQSHFKIPESIAMKYLCVLVSVIAAVAIGPRPTVGQMPEKEPVIWKDAFKDNRWKALALTPDKKYLVATYGQESLRIWEVATGKPLVTKNDAEYTKCLLLSKDGKLLFVNCRARNLPFLQADHIKILEVPTGKEVGQFKSGAVIAISPSGDHLLTMNYVDEKSCKLSLFDWNKRKEVWSATSGERFIGTAAFSRDGKLIATAHDGLDSFIELWDAATGKRLKRLGDRWTCARALPFVPDGETLAGITNGGGIEAMLWDLETGQASAF
jgi:WD40 repeat protein